jgi:SAM-dependent methyltransferase
MTTSNALDASQAFGFACPICHGSLIAIGNQILQCPNEGVAYPKVGGIWRFLPAERAAYFTQFMHEYETVRENERRGSNDSSYYRALPYLDLTGRWQKDWNIRARSFRALLKKVVKPMEDSIQNPLKILDIGAGNGWLSHRLSQRGHLLAAVDLLTNEFDGLGAFTHYDTRWIPVQAEMNALPFASNQADLLIYNASFHYSTGYLDTLKEAVRVLNPNGTLVILDSPIYHHPSSGVQMVKEREAAFMQNYGFRSNAIPSENFITFQRLVNLSDELGLPWRIVSPFYGLRWSLRPWWWRLIGRREPAQFHLIVAKLIASQRSNFSIVEMPSSMLSPR